MKNHTSFKTGGNAALFIEPSDEDELIKVLSACAESKIDTFVIGKGSNLLVSDDGIKNRAVIHIAGGMDEIMLVDDTTIKAGAGASLASLCKFALANSLTGLEFAYGIPGSCGGAAFMNAGAYGGEMKDVLISCEHIDKNGVKGSFSGDELDLSYRHSAYSGSNLIITSLTIKLQKGEKSDIESKMNELMGRRKDKQPLEYPSAGSVFKRPVGYFAGALIEQSDLKGKMIGGAMVSKKHAGFIINYDNCTTSDVIELIKHCQKTVKDKFGVDLETEIRFVL
ncbi:MAG: UDP-N-acetylmuramate dehydrogenase [Clostridia bacterium]|nr:UDP-N-acetylmuramate dehydrogenase [Clostridia bacterium]